APVPYSTLFRSSAEPVVDGQHETGSASGAGQHQVGSVLTDGDQAKLLHRPPFRVPSRGWETRYPPVYSLVGPGSSSQYRTRHVHRRTPGAERAALPYRAIPTRRRGHGEDTDSDSGPFPRGHGGEPPRWAATVPGVDRAPARQSSRHAGAARGRDGDRGGGHRPSTRSR